jgi:hypothetical protein
VAEMAKEEKTQQKNQFLVFHDVEKEIIEKVM